MPKREDQTILEEITEDLWKLFQIEKRPIRHFLSGFEAEFIILDSNGFVSNAADTILEKSGTIAKKECARNMLEIATMPAAKIGFKIIKSTPWPPAVFFPSGCISKRFKR